MFAFSKCKRFFANNIIFQHNKYETNFVLQKTNKNYSA